MKATDLMCGDWVKIKGHLDYDKVREIAMDEKMQWYISYACSMTLFRAYEFEPVPITREILEKNGWERDIDKEWKYNNSHILPHYCYQWEKQNVKIEMYAGLEGFTISLIIGRRFYAVHELQHVLRLYGLDELADNFKI